MEGLSQQIAVTPNFFIVGAPKSGTTSLFQYLRQHPDVFMPDVKASHFLSTDLHRTPRITLGQYLQSFQKGMGKKRIGEASADYLHSKDACERIKNMFPDAKIVIILRNPVDKVHSGHSQRLWRGWEVIDDFEKALAVDEGVEQEARYRRPADQVGMLSYRQSAMYAKDVRRYIETFGRERVHVMIFEDFARDTEGSFRELCRFLEIPEDLPIRFERYNSSKKARVPTISRLFLRTSTARHVGSGLPEPVRRVARSFTQRLMKWNTRQEKRVPMSPEVRRRLENDFAGDVAELSVLLGRDLSAFWFSTSKEEPLASH